MSSATLEKCPVRNLPLDALVLDEAIQPREHLDEATVEEYAAAMAAGDRFPPIAVFTTDFQTYIVGDGFHRVPAARKAGHKHIAAEIHSGDREDAAWHAAGSNRSHGLRRTNADKARAVRMALMLPGAASVSDRAIAKHVGVDHETVAKYRAELESTGGIPQSTIRTGADGRTIDTANIGKSAQPAEPEAADEPPFDIDPTPAADTTPEEPIPFDLTAEPVEPLPPLAGEAPPAETPPNTPTVAGGANTAELSPQQHKQADFAKARTAHGVLLRCLDRWGLLERRFDTPKLTPAQALQWVWAMIGGMRA